MNEYESSVDDRDLALALRRLDAGVVVPEVDPAREAALMAAFDLAHRRPAASSGARQYWFMAALATAAAVLMTVGLNRPTSRDFQPGPEPPSEFVMVPGAGALPRMESGSLVRMDVPVAMLPSLGVTPPPANRATSVRADVIVAQDGLPRAVRLVD